MSGPIWNPKTEEAELYEAICTRERCKLNNVVKIPIPNAPLAEVNYCPGELVAYAALAVIDHLVELPEPEKEEDGE